MRKKNPADLTARNLKVLLRRLTKAEQQIILLQGDRNKLQRLLDAEIKARKADVRDLDATISEIMH